MKDLTIVTPYHKFDDEIRKMSENMYKSVDAAVKNYKHGKVTLMAVATADVCENGDFKALMDERGVKIVQNNGASDYCSQINRAAEEVKTEHFSVIEFDDEYTPKWLNMAHDYSVGNETMSVIIPVNLYHDEKGENWSYGNTMALTPMFITTNENDTDPVGVINRHRLEGMAVFNLTGAVINTADFIMVGGFKPSIEVAFNFEFLLRLTENGMKAMVAPKEGYKHTVARTGSLTDEYNRRYTEADIEKWFNLAYKECKYKEDRGNGIDTLHDETLS